ncbi:uncharacterized protein LOC125665755 [Ostrea edulis]|uniref:uncharacterized protein LOC125665755 n=1 Tax=Ostrea edulis TaxID=37623 RepID=UPI002094C3F1|nr:uncharacterized protein LOC125665755 [Ostrea edulis]
MRVLLCLTVIVAMVAADNFELDLNQDTVVLKQGTTCYFWRLNKHELESVQSPTGIYEIEAKYHHLLSAHTHFGDLADMSIYSTAVQSMCAGTTLKTYSHH